MAWVTQKQTRLSTGRGLLLSCHQNFWISRENHMIEPVCQRFVTQFVEMFFWLRKRFASFPDDQQVVSCSLRPLGGQCHKGGHLAIFYTGHPFFAKARWWCSSARYRFQVFKVFLYSYVSVGVYGDLTLTCMRSWLQGNSVGWMTIVFIDRCIKSLLRALVLSVSIGFRAARLYSQK